MRRAVIDVGSNSVLLVVAGPWFVAIEWATHGGFFADSVGHDLFAKLGGAQESHGAPPFYYVALSLITFLPGSLFVVRSLRIGEPPRQTV